MKNIGVYIVAIILAIGATLATQHFTAAPNGQSAMAEKKESVYDRVTASGTLRCGYFIWPPAVMKDEATGELTGFIVDYFEALGQALDLEVEWSQELNFSTYLQDLNAGRYDIECSGGWPNASRGKLVDYTTPIGYLPMYGYTRADDTRFDNNLDAINNPDVRYVAIDGETSAHIRKRRFPNSTLVSLPQITPFTDLLLNVETGKADVAVIDASQAYGYLSANPGSIRRVASDPIRVLQMNAGVAQNNFEFLEMIDTATKELIYDGVIDQILNKYDPTQTQILRLTDPYEVN